MILWIVVALLNIKVLVSNPSIDISGIKTNNRNGIHAGHHLFKHKVHVSKNADLVENGRTTEAATNKNKLNSDNVAAANAEKVSMEASHKSNSSRIVRPFKLKAKTLAPKEGPPEAERVKGHKRKHTKSHRHKLHSADLSSRFRKVF